MTNQIASDLLRVQAQLNQHFLERHEVVEAMVLALLAKQHGFMLGPPGTAKSALVRALVSHIDGASYFETVLSRTRPAEAVLGQWDLKRLKEENLFLRRTTSYLPEANIAFLDEVGKMGASLGHDLLSVLNERRLHQVADGKSWLDVPLYTCFTGSNELPTSESDDAAALWDRLLIRTTVDRIQEDSQFGQLLTLGEYEPQTKIPWTDLANVIDVEVKKITLPKDVQDAIISLRRELSTDGITPSDRRWRESVKVLRASAFLGGREEIEVEDMHVLRHTLWDSPEHLEKVSRACMKIADPQVEELTKMREECSKHNAGMDRLMGRSLEERGQFAIEISPKLKELIRQVDEKRQVAMQAGRSTTQIDRAATAIRETYQRMFVDMMGMPVDKVKGKA